jgi:hypothetical protein
MVIFVDPALWVVVEVRLLDGGPRTERFGFYRSDEARRETPMPPSHPAFVCAASSLAKCRVAT